MYLYSEQKTNPQNVCETDLVICTIRNNEKSKLWGEAIFSLQSCIYSHCIVNLLYQKSVKVRG